MSKKLTLTQNRQAREGIRRSKEKEERRLGRSFRFLASHFWFNYYQPILFTHVNGGKMNKVKDKVSCGYFVLLPLGLPLPLRLKLPSSLLAVHHIPLVMKCSLKNILFSPFIPPKTLAHRFSVDKPIFSPYFCKKSLTFPEQLNLGNV